MVIIDGNGTVIVDKNASVFTGLVQLLDDRILFLMIRDAKGKESIEILREYFLGKSKPRVISTYTELTSLKLVNEESVTDYIIRAEKISIFFQNAGEVISDSLLVAMIMKGLFSVL